MFADLQGLGYGIIVFAVIVGVGSVVLYNFAGATANCSSSTLPAATWNVTDGLCHNGTGTAETPHGASYVNTDYLLGELGSSGLAGWTPAIIAISVGLLFLGAFLVRKGGKRQY